MSKSENPYSVIFGQEPAQMISREVQSDQIIHAFNAKTPSKPCFIITGVRGCGKTVLMTDILQTMRKSREWVVEELNPSRDLLQSLAAKLSSHQTFAKIFQNAGINLSLFGFGLEVKNSVPIADIDTALEKMLDSLQSHGKKILVAIDEISDTRQMREFSHSFQIFRREKLPIYLLMTGLYENIRQLQDEPDLTFLYRAPRIELPPLNMTAIKLNYQNNFKLSSQDAMEMAKMTKGYSFAFQVLGYLTWENDGNFRSVSDEYRQYLEDYVYMKIWSELSGKDQLVAYGVAMSTTGKVEEVQNLIHFNHNQFSPYRKRLIDKGIIASPSYGHLSFTLPLFREFVLDRHEEEQD